MFVRQPTVERGAHLQLPSRIAAAATDRATSFRSTVREHRILVLVLVLAIALRIAAWIAYRPALFFPDSWAYGSTARSHEVAGIFVPGLDRVRPSGYPAILDLLALVSRSAALVAIAQHLAGILAGVVVYALCRRLGAPRPIAAIATGIVVLDSYAIVLEQYVLSEAFFGLALLSSFYLVTDPRRGWASIGAGGLLLALATTIRTAALFAIPVWLAYVIMTRRRRGTVLVGAAAVLVPLLLYASVHALAHRGFALTETEGWFLYGRVGQIADCTRFTPSAAQRPLCQNDPPPGIDRNPRWYLWDPASPAAKMFKEPGFPDLGGRVGGPAFLSDADLKRSNSLLRDFAFKVIRSRPGAYSNLVASDFARFFEPGRMSQYGADSDAPIVFAEHPWPMTLNPKARSMFDVSSPTEAHTPSGFLREYQRFVHTPRWLLAGFTVAALAVLLLGFTRRLRPFLPRRPEVILLIGSALLMLLGTVATANFEVRYLVPVVPLFVCGGVAALIDLSALFALRRRNTTAAPPHVSGHGESG